MGWQLQRRRKGAAIAHDKETAREKIRPLPPSPAPPLSAAAAPGSPGSTGRQERRHGESRFAPRPSGRPSLGAGPQLRLRQGEGD